MSGSDETEARGSKTIARIEGTAVYVPGDDIDTDRIIPARYLKLVTFNGLGRYAFFDVRHNSDGAKTRHPLNDERYAGASVMLTGSNFGCGSSREHAPQSLYRAGFRAIVAESFAEIFFGNSLALGLVCVAASKEAIRELAAAIEADPDQNLTIDIDTLRIAAGAGEHPVFLPTSARDALVSGEWDPLQQLMARTDEVRAVFERLPYTAW